jgi:hypothetical protein
MKKRLLGILLVLMISVVVSSALAGDNDDDWDGLYFTDYTTATMSFNAFMDRVTEYLGYTPYVQVLQDEWPVLTFDFPGETVRLPLEDGEDFYILRFDAESVDLFLLSELSWYRSEMIGKNYLFVQLESGKFAGIHGMVIVLDEYGDAYIQFNEDSPIYYQVQNIAYIDGENAILVSGDELAQYFYDFQMESERNID